MTEPKAKREYSRIAALPDDPRVAVIRQAFANCRTTLRCRSREHLRDGEYQDIERLIGLLDDLQLHHADREGFLAIGHALNMAVEMSAYVGAAAPKESVGESFAAESLIEGQTNSAVALAMDAPKSPGRRLAAIAWINRHIGALVRQRIVFQRESRQIEGGAR